MEPQFAARCSPKGCLAADCGRTGACGRGFPASRISAMVRAPPDDDAAQTLGDDRDLLLLHPVLALGVSCRPAAAGRRAAPPRSASAEALRLPGRGAADRRRADPDAAEAAARLSRGRARPLAPAPRHAAEPDAALLSDGEPGAGLEQARRPHGDRRAPGRRRPFPAVACAPAGALGGGARHRRPARARRHRRRERLRRPGTSRGGDDGAGPAGIPRQRRRGRSGSASSGRRPSSSRASCSGDRTGSISSIGRSTGCAGQRARRRAENREPKVR